MDKESQENLQRILSLSEEELTREDIMFLRARRSYLTKTQVHDYSHLLFDKRTEQPQQPQSQPKQSKQPKPVADKDVRLNLDKKEEEVAEQTQPAAQPQQEVKEPVQPEATNDAAPEEEEEVPCLDPDCTHENHQ